MGATRTGPTALLLLGLWMITLCAGCGEPPPLDTSLLTGDPCEPPCWQGLTPGVPSYEDQRWTFNPKAANVGSALRGIQKGIDGLDRSELRDFGVAIYAEWTTDDEEWEMYRREWLGAN